MVLGGILRCMTKVIKALGYDFGYEQVQLGCWKIRRDAGCVEMEGVYCVLVMRLRM